MRRQRDEGSGGVALKTWPGFTRQGAFFKSDSRVENPVTVFVRRAIALVRDKHATPADLLVEVLREGKDVQSLFVGVAGQWSNLDRYHQWPCAVTSNSVQEAIKRQGAGDSAPWAHEATWRGVCDAAERSRGQTSRHEGHPQAGESTYVDPVPSLLGLLGEGWGQ